MEVKASELIGEYGGKLVSCENVMVRSLDKLALQPNAHEYQDLAKESALGLKRLRARYNLVLQAHGQDLDPLLSGSVSVDQDASAIALTKEQVWVLDSIDDMYERLTRCHHRVG